MPCYTERIVTVELSGTTDAAILARAIEAAGLRAHAGADLKAYAAEAIRRGALTFLNVDERRAQELGARVKQEYVRQGTLVLAKKYGFAAKVNPETKQITLTRKAF